MKRLILGLAAVMLAVPALADEGATVNVEPGAPPLVTVCTSQGAVSVASIGTASGAGKPFTVVVSRSDTCPGE